jgi:hypothetical protein
LLWLSAKKKQEKSELLEEVSIDGSGNFLPESKENSHHVYCIYKITGSYKFFPKSKVFGGYYAQHLTENSTGSSFFLYALCL